MPFQRSCFFGKVWLPTRASGPADAAAGGGRHPGPKCRRVAEIGCTISHDNIDVVIQLR